jgi:hypothetical protein
VVAEAIPNIIKEAQPTHGWVFVGCCAKDEEDDNGEEKHAVQCVFPKSAHLPNVHAGASEGSPLHHGHFGAPGRGPPSRRHAATSCTNHLTAAAAAAAAAAATTKSQATERKLKSLGC